MGSSRSPRGMVMLLPVVRVVTEAEVAVREDTLQGKYAWTSSLHQRVSPTLGVGGGGGGGRPAISVPLLDCRIAVT